MGRDILIFGDSNVLVFRNLHREPGCGHWRPGLENPVGELDVLVPKTIVRMTWDSLEFGAKVEAYAFIAATAGGLGRLAATGGEIRRVLQERGIDALRVLFLFGQMDLDFVLWHVLGRETIDVNEFIRERAETYIRFISGQAEPRGAVSVLEVHPQTIADENLFGFFQKYKLELPRFQQASARELLAACPWFEAAQRAGIRRTFAEHVRRLCAQFGYDYLETPEALAQDHTVRPEYACRDPFEVHVSLPHVLPLWLDKLPWLRQEAVAAR